MQSAATEKNDNEYLTPAQVAARFALRGGKRMAPTTITRWASRGIIAPSGERVRLPSRRIGRAIVIAAGDLEAFFAALSPQATELPRSPAQRDRASSAAAKKLNEMRVGV